MTIEAWGAIGEIVGALAVILSLIFVGFQVRANTKEQALNRIRDRNALNVRSQNYLLENPDVRRIWVKGADGLASLTEEERVAYGAYMSQWVASMLDILEQRNAGQMSDEDWHQVPLSARPVTVRKGAIEWWQRVRHTFKPSLQAFIDGLFEQGQKKAIPHAD